MALGGAAYAAQSKLPTRGSLATETRGTAARWWREGGRKERADGGEREKERKREREGTSEMSKYRVNRRMQGGLADVT